MKEHPQGSGRPTNSTTPAHGDLVARHLHELQRIPMLSRAEEEELGTALMRDEPTARRRLVEANLRFVVHVAREYTGMGLPLEDLIAEGHVGLIEAAERYDPERGVRFISFAVWWVRRAIRQALTWHGRLVRLPENRVRELARVRSASEALAQRLGRGPRPDEVAHETGLADDVVATLLETDAPLVPEQQARGIAAQGWEPILENDTLPERIGRMLPPVQAEVLALHYGLRGEDPMSLRETGQVLGFSGERARQLRNEALATLRHHMTNDDRP